ncbi:hypothetical protein GCM10010289_83640 [Streptomyces violascens]|uniref:Uncharacterized protein n=1 Tax=Streptomyces violascens TaxID=67381 RepID=A0ABQ3R1T3_9ACTN|nr:hypothetical protein GCM10010289_83640 [Streptomyces violascens]GHI43457.1 hypothetical protein Sviol_78650 [Streptomyces violascens]
MGFTVAAVGRRVPRFSGCPGGRRPGAGRLSSWGRAPDPGGSPTRPPVRGVEKFEPWGPRPQPPPCGGSAPCTPEELARPPARDGGWMG